MPANAAYAPIIVRREDMNPTQILGVVTGVYRKL
jgi:SOS-response transcriptional repressor LexA